MATYSYQLKQTDGQVVAGTMKADSLMLATQQVRELGGTILDLMRIGEDAVPRKGLLGIQLGQRVGSKEILAFTNQLAVMAKAGIGLTTALESIGEQTKHPKMAATIQTLKRDIEGGRQFSETLQRFPKIFSLLYVNMVRASELSGTFGHMLERITDYLTQQIETRRQVKGARFMPPRGSRSKRAAPSGRRPLVRCAESVGRPARRRVSRSRSTSTAAASTPSRAAMAAAVPAAWPMAMQQGMRRTLPSARPVVETQRPATSRLAEPRGMRQR